MEKKTIENMDYNYELYTQIENLKIIKEWVSDIGILLRKIEKIDINNIQKQIEEAYQRGVEDGRNETWEAARNIALYHDEGGTSILDLTEIFDCFTIQQVFRRYTVSEVIEKLKAYEEKQKAKDEIKVSDEVIDEDDKKFWVTKIHNGVAEGIMANGEVTCAYLNVTERTGRHNEKILELLDEMKE